MSSWRDAVGKSVTALEIEFGILADPEQCRRVWFYFREPLPGGDPPGSPAAVALEELKARIRRQFPGRFGTYRGASHPAGRGQTNLEEFGLKVAENLWSDLEEELRDAASRPLLHWTKLEDQVQADFVAIHGRWFRGHRELVEQLLDFTLATGGAGSLRAAMILAVPGAGKSSLYAHLAGHERLRQSGALVLYHAAGISTRSTGVDDILFRWVAQLAPALGREAPDDEIPKYELQLTFAAYLREIASPPDPADAHRVVLLLDGYDQLDQPSQEGDDAWLLGDLGENVRVLLTMSPNRIPNAGRLDLARFVLPPLTPEEIREIVSDRSQREHRQLNPRVLEALMRKRGPSEQIAAGNPPWIELAMGRLLDFNERDYARAKDLENTGLSPDESINQAMTDIVGEMPPDVPGMYQWLLHRMEDFPVLDLEWVRLFAMFVAIGREGWRESDLLRLMAIGQASIFDQFSPVQELQHLPVCFILKHMNQIQPVPALKFAVLRRAFAEHLAQRGVDGRYIFAQPQMREAVVRRYFNFVPAHPDVGYIELEEGLAALGQRANATLRGDLQEKGLVPGKLVTLCHQIAFEYLLSLPSSDGLRRSELMYHCMHAQHKLPFGGLSPSPGWYYASISDPSELRAATRVLAGYIASDEQFPFGEPAGWRMVERMLDPNISNGLPADMRRTRGWSELEPISGHPQTILIDRFQHHLARELERRVGSARRDEMLKKLQMRIEGELGELARLAERQGSRLGRSQAALNLGNQYMARGEASKAVDTFRQAAAELFDESGAPPPGTGADELLLIAIIHSRMGVVLESEGRSAEALDAFRTYVSLLERRSHEFPTDPRCEYDLAVGLGFLGGALFREEQYDEAKSTLLRALDILLMTPEIPADELLQRDLCLAAERLGNYLSAFGLTVEMEKSWQRSHTLARHRLAEDPENAELQAIAARCAQRLGEQAAASKRFDDSKRLLEEALSWWHRLAAAELDDREISLNQSLCLNALGKIAQMEGDIAGAYSRFDQRVQILERMIARKPDDTEARRSLAITHKRLSDLSLERGDVPTSLHHHSQYVEILRKLAAELPGDPKAACDVAISLCSYGELLKQSTSPEHAEPFCRESYDRLLALSNSLPEDPLLRWDVEETLRRLAHVALQARSQNAEPDAEATSLYTAIPDEAAGNVSENRESAIGSQSERAGHLEDWLREDRRPNSSETKLKPTPPPNANAILDSYDDLVDRVLKLLVDKDPQRALACLDEAIATLRPLADAGIDRAIIHLATTLANKGSMTGAWPLLEEAEILIHDLVERRASPKCCWLWMSIQLDRLMILLRSDRVHEAQEILEAALTLLEKQMSEGWDKAWYEPQQNMLLHMARQMRAAGQRLRNEGRFEAALTCSAGGANAYSRLLPEGDAGEWSDEQANCLLDQGATLCDLGRPSDAIRACDEATAWLQRLIEERTRLGKVVKAAEARQLLSKNLMNRGIALRGKGRLSDSLASFEDAMNWLPGTSEADPELVVIRALIESLKGSTLIQMRDFSKTIASFDCAVQTLLPITGRGCPADRVVLLAKCLINKTATLIQAKRIADASEWADRVVSEMRRLADLGHSEILGEWWSRAEQQRADLARMSG